MKQKSFKRESTAFCAVINLMCCFSGSAESNARKENVAQLSSILSVVSPTWETELLWSCGSAHWIAENPGFLVSKVLRSNELFFDPHYQEIEHKNTFWYNPKMYKTETNNIHKRKFFKDL